MSDEHRELALGIHVFITSRRGAGARVLWRPCVKHKFSWVSVKPSQDWEVLRQGKSFMFCLKSMRNLGPFSVCQRSPPAPGDIWHCPETFFWLSLLGQRVLLASCRCRPEKLLNLPQCTAQLPQPLPQRISPKCQHCQGSEPLPNHPLHGFMMAANRCHRRPCSICSVIKERAHKLATYGTKSQLQSFCGRQLHAGELRPM